MSLRRFQTSALGAFAVAAVAIATIGLYGVIAYSVRQRAREIGVRLALGAGARTILLMVLAQGAGLTFAGVVLGAFAYWFVAGVLTSMLYDVAETDPAVLGSVAGLIWAVGLLASYIPARRATRIDPATTLRSESY